MRRLCVAESCVLIAPNPRFELFLANGNCAIVLERGTELADIKIYDGAGHAFMNPNNKHG